MEKLEKIPFVGKKIAEHLNSAGINCVSDLKNKDPEKLFLKICQKQGKKIDRCLLYVLRMAVYYASNKKPDPALLYWWVWKDK